MADMATEHFSAILSPHALGGRVEITHAKIAIDNHHGIVRPLKRGQKEVRGLNHRVIARVHHPTLMPVKNPPRPGLDGEAPF